MAKQKTKLVHCRYPKCNKLHATTELNREDAVQGGSKNSYYHPDCWEMLQTINKIKDIFIKEVNPAMTGQQIGQLVSIVNNMVFSKNIDVDYILFAIRFFTTNKPGKLRYPGGVAYIVQDKDVISSWEREKQQRVKEKIKEQSKAIKQDDEFGLDFLESTFVYKPQKARSFEDILR